MVLYSSFKASLSFTSKRSFLVSLAQHSASIPLPVNSEHSFLFASSTSLSQALSQVSPQSDASCLRPLPPDGPLVCHPCAARSEYAGTYRHLHPALLTTVVTRGLFRVQTASQPSRNLYQKSIT